MRISSSAFEDGDLIPEKYTCFGDNMSPPLNWREYPQETKSFILLCEDSDTSPKPYIHWLMYNIPIKAHSIRENVPQKEKLPYGAKQGINDFGNIGYYGPCPHKGLRHYVFRILALDTNLKIKGGINNLQILRICENHILAEGVLRAKFSRNY